MPKKKPEIRMVSYGLYTPFDKADKALPQVLEFTTEVPAVEGTEFGYILNLRKARGGRIQFTIEHPPFSDEAGRDVPPFEGEEPVRSNDFDFFLGDCIWPPVEAKVGDWTLTTRLAGEVIASKTFHVVPAGDGPSSAPKA